MEFDFDKNVEGFLKKERNETKVQELIFRKPQYSGETAVKWAKDNKYIADKTRESDMSFRIQQTDVGNFVKHSLKVVNIGEGVDAVIGKKLKEE